MLLIDVINAGHGVCARTNARRRQRVRRTCEARDPVAARQLHHSHIGSAHLARMSKRITQPVNQVRLTNVAMVRMKRHGHRFEIACYKNKVVNWRNGVEKDLDEVLQIRNVFSNVSKVRYAARVLARRLGDTCRAGCAGRAGQVNRDDAGVWHRRCGQGVPADPRARRAADFGQGAKSAVRGVSRASGVVVAVCTAVCTAVRPDARSTRCSLFRDIATIVAEKCVNPETKRPYTVRRMGPKCAALCFARRSATRACWTGGHDREGHAERALLGADVSGRKAAGARARTHACSMRDGVAGLTQWVQALECIAELRKVIPIERAKMRLRLRVAARGARWAGCCAMTGMMLALTVPLAVGESLKAALHKREAGIESELWGEHYAVTCQLTPGFFREVDHLVRELDPGARRGRPWRCCARRTSPRLAEGGSLEVLDLAVHAEGAETLELEAAAPAEAAPVWRGAEAVAVPSVAAAAAAAAPAGGSGAAGAGAFKCRTCGVAFAERAGHREHYKSEWHRFNLKRGMKELPAVTEDEFMRVDAAAKEAFLREL